MPEMEETEAETMEVMEEVILAEMVEVTLVVETSKLG